MRGTLACIRSGAAGGAPHGLRVLLAPYSSTYAMRAEVAGCDVRSRHQQGAVHCAARAQCVRRGGAISARACLRAWNARRRRHACACAPCASQPCSLCRRFAFWPSTYAARAARYDGSREPTHAEQARESPRSSSRRSGTTGRARQHNGATQQNGFRGMTIKEWVDGTACSFQFCAAHARDGELQRGASPATTRGC